MTVAEFLELLKIVVWPVVSMVALLAVRPSLAALLSGSRVKLTIAGQSIETTLPELKAMFEEQTTEPLTASHDEYLRELRSLGAKPYPKGVDDTKTRDFLRPLRNAGLIHTHPRGVRLKNANSISLSGLGRLYLGAKA
jgi:hypothetical protein